MRERWRALAVGVALVVAVGGLVGARLRWSAPSPAPCDALLDAAWVESASGHRVRSRVHRLPGFCEIVFLAGETVDGLPRVAVVAAGVEAPDAARRFAVERRALVEDPSVLLLADEPDRVLVHWRRQRVLLVRAGGVWGRWSVADRYIPPEAAPVEAWAARLPAARGLAEERR